MACLSAFLESSIHQQIFTGGSPYVPSSLWLALCNQPVQPGITGTRLRSQGNEVDLNLTNYHRQEVGVGPDNWVFSTNNLVGVIKNKNTITYAPATYQYGVNGGLVKYWALCDADWDGIYGGNMLYYGEFTNDNTVNLAQQVVIAPSALVITIS